MQLKFGLFKWQNTTFHKGVLHFCCLCIRKLWWYQSIPIDVLLEEQGQLSTWRSHGCCCLENQECTRQCWECIFQKRNTSLSHGQSLHLQFSSPSLSRETQGHSFWDLGSYFEADPILTIQLPNFMFQSNVIGFWEQMCHLWQAEMWFSLFKKPLQKDILLSQLVLLVGEVWGGYRG